MAESQIIRLPNNLAKRIGPRLRVFTAELVRKAEAALEQISSHFGEWLEADIAALDLAWGKSKATDPANPKLSLIAGNARNLRSAGATLGFPLVSRIAASLCILIEQKRSGVPTSLVDAHIDAIKAALRDNIRDEADYPAARAIAAELEASVEARK
jgi:hypothetical protein